MGSSNEISPLPVKLLKHSKATCRRAKSITLNVDNAIIHQHRETLRWLKDNPEFSRFTHRGLITLNGCGRHHMTRSSTIIIAVQRGTDSKR